MFLNLLDNDEKLAFVELAERMIEADGLVIGREEASLAALKAEMGTPSEAIGGRTIEELAGVFKGWRSKVVALLELIGLGYTDTSFSIGEQSLVDQVAQTMGLGEKERASIEEWVQEHVSLIRRALILMRD